MVDGRAAHRFGRLASSGSSERLGNSASSTAGESSSEDTRKKQTEGEAEEGEEGHEEEGHEEGHEEEGHEEEGHEEEVDGGEGEGDEEEGNEEEDGAVQELRGGRWAMTGKRGTRLTGFSRRRHRAKTVASRRAR